MIFMNMVTFLGFIPAWRWFTRKWAGYRWYYVDDGHNDPMWLYGWSDDYCRREDSWFAWHPATGIMLMECEGSRPWKNSMIEVIEK